MVAVNIVGCTNNKELFEYFAPAYDLKAVSGSQHTAEFKKGFIIRRMKQYTAVCPKTGKPIPGYLHTTYTFEFNTSLWLHFHLAPPLLQRIAAVKTEHFEKSCFSLKTF